MNLLPGRSSSKHPAPTAIALHSNGSRVSRLVKSMTHAAQQQRQFCAQQQQDLQLTLYDDPHSEYCAKVKVAMHHKGLTWQSLPVKPCGGEHLSPDFSSRVPLGKIPALVVVQKTTGQNNNKDIVEHVLYESEVINEWLQEQFPQPPMLPACPMERSQARLISRFHDLYLEPAMRKLYPQVDPSIRTQEAVAAASQEFCTRLKQLDCMLPDNITYAIGATLSLADCAYPGLLLYAELIWPVLGLGQLDYSDVPKVLRWKRVCWQDESVMKVLQELEPAAREWIDKKAGRRQCQ